MIPLIVTQFIIGSLLIPAIIVIVPNNRGMVKMYTTGCTEHPFFQSSFACGPKGGCIMATNEPMKMQAIAEQMMPNHHLLSKSTMEKSVLNPETIHNVIKANLIAFPNFIFLNSDDASIEPNDGISSQS